jgi:hypothetical protein
MKYSSEQSTTAISTHIAERVLNLNMNPFIRSETSAGQLFGDYAVYQFGEYNIISNAIKIISHCNNHEVVARAKKILYIINDALNKVASDIDITNKISEIYAYVSEDVVVYLEWIYPDIRIGFSIEASDLDSTWYMVTTIKVGGIEASGVLTDDSIQRTIMWVISFLLMIWFVTSHALSKVIAKRNF